MSPTRAAKANWKPNDKVIEGKPGAARIKAALTRRRVTFTKRVVTSRDPGMSDVIYDLGRPDMPPGIRSWQLPFVLGGGEGGVFFFLTVAEPGAITTGSPKVVVALSSASSPGASMPSSLVRRIFIKKRFDG